MSHSHNVLLTKCYVRTMSHSHTVLLAKCHVRAMPHSHTDTVAQCHTKYFSHIIGSREVDGSPGLLETSGEMIMQHK